jgi:hypothetical protein
MWLMDECALLHTPDKKSPAGSPGTGTTVNNLLGATPLDLFRTFTITGP